MKVFLRRLLPCFLVILMVLGSAASLSASVKADEDTFTYRGKTYQKSKDVPAIYIENVYGLNVYNYVDCTIVAVDKIGGQLTPVADRNATVRIRGNSTSSGPKKPYNIKFSANTDLFGMGKGKRFCLIANLYDPTLIRNHMVFEFARDLGMQYTLDSMLVDVYYNGSYVGCYQLCEAATEDDSRVDIDCSKGDYIIERDAREDYGTTYITTSLGHRFGINEPENTTNAQRIAIENHLRMAENAIRSRDIEQVKKYFDLESIIDSYICLEFFKNVDIVVGSTRFYCKDGKIHGGPVWDYDLSSGNCSSTYYVSYNNNFGDSAEGIWCNHIWYDDLLLIDEYKEMLYDRYLEVQDQIINLYRDNVRGKNAIDSIIGNASTSINRNFTEAPWRPGRNYSELMRIPDSTYEANVEHLRAWLERRNTWLLTHWGLNGRVKPKLKDTSYSYSGTYLLGFKPETTVFELESIFSERVTIDTVGEIISTGDSFRGQGASYYAVVEGDINCDGKVTPADYILLKQTLAGKYKPTGAAYKAACMDKKQPKEENAQRIKEYRLTGRWE